MLRTASLASLALLAAAPPAPARAADIPPEPGVYWEQKMEMQMAGFSMPGQTSKVCLPKKGMDEPPRGRDDGKCKMTDVKRSGQHMTWKMKCEDGTTGEGDITGGPDSYTGSMRMTSQGRDMQMKMSGKKLGGDCDAAEVKRQVAGIQKQVADAQASQAKAHKEGCEESADKMQLHAFVPFQPGLPVQCTDSTRFCANLETRKGLLAFKACENPRAELRTAEKLCKKDLAAIERRFCADAQKVHEKKTRFDDADTLEYAFACCSDLAKTLSKRECSGRSFTSMPQQQRDFCTTYAARELSKPAPGAAKAAAEDAAPTPAAVGGKYLSSGIPDVDDPPATKKSSKKKKAAEEDEEKPKDEDMKSKIFKGLFGR